MKLTKTRLKQIIKEEIGNITEDKATHISGIAEKIKRLRAAVDNARRGMANMEAGAVDDMDLMDIQTTNQYWSKQVEISNLEDKITLLLKQLKQLKQDVPGELERPQ